MNMALTGREFSEVIKEVKTIFNKRFGESAIQMECVPEYWREEWNR